MFNQENWNTEKIVKGLSRIPTYQTHYMVCMAMLGGGVFIVGLLRAARMNKEVLDKVLDALGLMGLVVISFGLCRPLPYIIYLFNELQKTRDRLKELAGKQP